MKTIVFAYSEFGCIGIEALVAAGYQVGAVFTYRDDPQETVFYRSVARVCIEQGVPAYTIDPDNREQRLAMVHKIAPEYIFSFYYRSLISDDVLALAKKGAYNLHGSLLPHYRGRAPVNWVLVKGETQTGVTLHHMVARADAGDIVAQAAVDIGYDDTAFTLQHKLLTAARSLLQEQLPLIAQGKAARHKQDIAAGNYCGRRGPEDGRIDWSRPAEVARNLVRAVTFPYPGAFTVSGGKKLLIWEAAVVPQQGLPGIILSLEPLSIACGADALVVRCGQVEDGLCLSGAQLANDYGLQAGTPIADALTAAL